MNRHPPGSSRQSVTVRAALFLLRVYQLSASSLLGRQCRYLPTCSDYAGEAIARHGLWRGGMMGAGRVCRCQPWGGSGFDPVPEQLPAGRSWLVLWRRVAPQDRASNCAESP